MKFRFEQKNIHKKYIKIMEYKYIKKYKKIFKKSIDIII